jgi:large subunit ribosomal protein L4
VSSDEVSADPGEGTVAAMLKVNVFNRQGEAVGTIDVDPAEFGGEINKQMLHDVIIMYLANQRAGTHSTLRRGEVAGSTKKLFRQKGTGNARVGTRRTNKRRGGGTAKGPKPRDYEYHMPRKMVQAATRMAILSKFQDNEAVVVEDLNLPETQTPKGEALVKTKEVAAVLKALKLTRQTILVGTAGLDKKLHKAARNIDGLKLLPAKEFNAYTVLKQKRLLLTRAALEELRRGAKKTEATETK